MSLYAPLTSCKISKKSNEPIQRTVGYGQTDGQTDSTHFIGPSGYAGGPINGENAIWRVMYATSKLQKMSQETFAISIIAMQRLPEEI